MRNARAFTFVELLIGVTVSAIIMTGVVVFVGSGIDNAFKIRKGLEENAASADFDTETQKLAAFWGTLAFSGRLNPPYATGAVFVNGARPAPVTVLATRTATGVCDAYSWTTDQSGTGEILEISETYAPFWIQVESGFSIDSGAHVVKNGGTAILGTGNPGYAGGNGWPALATELAHPTSVADFWADGQLVADAGNDRILLVRSGVATTFLWPEDGIRQPFAIATDGEEVRISMPDGALAAKGNPTENGSTFSGTFASDAGFAFDSMKITLWGGRIPPSSLANYAFDFGSPTGTVTVSGNVATLAFSWAAKSYSQGQTARTYVTWIPVTAGASWAYQATLQYFSWAVKRYERTLPYFVRGDGDPLTKNDDEYSFDRNVSGQLTVTAFEGGSFVKKPLSDFAALWETAPKSKETRSKRLVRDFAITASGGVATVTYGEYVRYDCLSWNHTVRDRVLKIPLK